MSQIGFHKTALALPKPSLAIFRTTLPLLVGWLTLTGAGHAIESPLSAASVNEAYTQGVTLGMREDQAYPLAPNAVYHTADTLRLEAANGDVDAVVIGTPWERVRYQSYLATIGGEEITPAQARERARLPDGSVAVLIFAHGSKPSDQDFISGFTGVTLKLGTTTTHPAEARRSGTSGSQYPDTPGEIGERFTGTITYIFHLTPAQLRNSGTLSFTDPTGKVFRLPIRLSAYR